MFLKSVKNTKCVVNMGSFKLKMHQNTFSAMAPPGPRWGSLQHPPDSLAGGRGLAAPWLPPPPNPTQLSALWTSIFGLWGLSTLPFGPPCLALRASGPRAFGTRTPLTDVWLYGPGMQVGLKKNHDFRPIPRFVSELMQDRSTVTIEGK